MSQAKPTDEEVDKLARVLGIQAGVRQAPSQRCLEREPNLLLTPTRVSQPLHSHWHKHYFPERGQLTPMPPTDPTLYRLYEIIAVYGYAIKSCVHEKCTSASACFPCYLTVLSLLLLSATLVLLL